MNDLLSVAQRPGEGLVLLNVRYFGDVYVQQLWVRVKARKCGTCAASGVGYKSGAEVYRPFGNTGNRSQREP